MSYATTMDVSHPEELKKTIIQVLGASLILAIFSQVRIPLFFTPVPLSLQTLGLLLVGAFLGKKKGTLAVLAYLAEGAIGLPVFAGGTGSGLASLIGPNGGYFVGFILVAFFSGFVVEKCKHVSTLFAGMLLASLTVFVTGLPWLALWVGQKNVFALGFFPFLLGDFIKVSIACCSVMAYRNLR